MTWNVFEGDCLDLLRDLPDECIDSIVTDPPYELGFMGKRWDASGVAYKVEVWREALRVLKPGGHLLAFGGTRTYHRMACAIEDAGFEVRDSIHWIYGSGFPKSMNVSKAFDRSAGELLPESTAFTVAGVYNEKMQTTAPSKGYVPPKPVTDAAKKWQGWGTALKPAHEPIVVARKPLDGTVAANVRDYGTGAINVDGCRVGTSGATKAVCHVKKADGRLVRWDESYRGARNGIAEIAAGRWPPNILLTHDEDCGDECVAGCPVDKMGDPAKFFPCFYYGTKAGRKERERGCENLPARSGAEAVEREEGSDGLNSPRAGAGRTAKAVRNHHPTVKPEALMQWLVRLVTPPGGTVLDPFTGSGTTGVAAVYEGFDFVGFEQSAEYVTIAEARIAYADRNKEKP